jgi:hypothetical protein
MTPASLTGVARTLVSAASTLVSTLLAFVNFFPWRACAETSLGAADLSVRATFR